MTYLKGKFFHQADILDENYIKIRIHFAIS